MKSIKYIEYCILATCIIVIAYLSFLSLRDPWLWYDEAVQFWVSKGLNHLSAPYSIDGNFSDLIHSNRNYTLDPGGWSALVFFWLKICDSNIVFIRLLPFLFFLGFAIVSFLYIYEQRHNLSEAAIIAMLMFMWPLTASTMTELRPYTMEMFGVASTLLFVDRLFKSPKISRNLLLLSLWMSLFCTSRHDFIIFAFCVSIFIIWELYRTNGFSKRFFLQCGIYSIPLISTVAVIWFTMMQYQINIGTQLHYVQYGGNNPVYLLGSGLFVLSVLNTAIIVSKIIKGNRPSASEKVFLIVFVVYLILTICNKVPWDTKRSFALTLILTLSLISNLLSLLNVNSYIKILILLAFFKTLYGGYEIMHMRQSYLSHPYEEYISTMDSIDYEKMFVTLSMSPSLRYLYEYGALKEYVDRDGYPDKFVFQYIPSNKYDQGSPFYAEDVDCDIYFFRTPTGKDTNMFKQLEGKQYWWVKTSK